MHLEYSYFILCVVNAIGMMNATDDVKYLQSLCENSLWTDLKELLLSINENGKPVALNEIVNVDSVTSETLSHKATQIHLLLSCNIAKFYAEYSDLAKSIIEPNDNDEIGKRLCKNMLKTEFQFNKEVIKNWRSSLSIISKLAGSHLKNEVDMIGDILEKIGTEELDLEVINANLENLHTSAQSFMDKNCYHESSPDNLRQRLQSFIEAMEMTQYSAILVTYMSTIRQFLASIHFKLNFQATEDLKVNYNKSIVTYYYSWLRGSDAESVIQN